jgi:hypothetical protein
LLVKIEEEYEMTRLLPLLLLMLSLPVLCQTTKPSPPSVPASVEADALTENEKDVLGKLKLAQLTSVNCSLSFERARSAECLGADKNLAGLFEKVARSPRIIRVLAAEAVNRYDSLAGETKSAMQASQIVDQQNVILMRLLVLQNQRIIELLDQILKKR